MTFFLPDNQAKKTHDIFFLMAGTAEKYHDRAKEIFIERMTVISQRFHDRLSERMLNTFFIQILLSHVHPQSSYEH